MGGKEASRMVLPRHFALGTLGPRATCVEFLRWLEAVDSFSHGPLGLSIFAPGQIQSKSDKTKANRKDGGEQVAKER